MKIAGVQFKPDLNNYESNLKYLLAMSNDISADMIIFPELSTSGYFYESKDELFEISEEFPGNSSSLIQKISTEQNKIIVYGFPEKVKDKIFNSAALIFPNENYNRIYRKTHLFFKERFIFEQGNTGFFVINYPDFDINIGTMICYDWRFPEAARTLALKGADLIICPANLVTNVWGKVMPGRAIENKVYYAVINRIGKERRGEDELFFNGESSIYGYNGERMASAGVEEEKVIYADITPSLTRKKTFNEFNDVFKDRRTEYYEL